MAKISTTYFNYNKIITIEIKNILDEVEQPIYVSIVNIIKAYNTTIRGMLKNYQCVELGEKQYALLESLETKKISIRNLFTNEFVKQLEYLKYFDISLIISGNELKLNNTKNKFIVNYFDIFETVYHYPSLLSLISCDVYIYFYTTIKISGHTFKTKQNDLLFKAIFPKFSYQDPNLELVLNSYNTFKSYKIDPKERLRDIGDQTILVSKTSHHYLKPPYGNCSDYQDNDRMFNSSNHWQCYRQCIKTMAENIFNCRPVLIEYTSHELDSDSYIECDSSVQKLFDEYLKTQNISSKCNQICPKNCVDIDFKMNVIKETQNDLGRNNSQTTNYRSLVWDTTQPMFVYKEELILSSIDYIVYCGGLVGLWFGTSAKDVIIIVFDKTFWFNLWHIILIKYNSNRNSIIVRHYN